MMERPPSMATSGQMQFNIKVIKLSRAAPPALTSALSVLQASCSSLPFLRRPYSAGTRWTVRALEPAPTTAAWLTWARSTRRASPAEVQRPCFNQFWVEPSTWAPTAPKSLGNLDLQTNSGLWPFGGHFCVTVLAGAYSEMSRWQKLTKRLRSTKIYSSRTAKGASWAHS